MSSHTTTMNSEDDADQPFPYELLLAFIRNDIEDLQQHATVAERLKHSQRWRSHYKSAEFLDLEREVAIQDGKELGKYQPPTGDERDFCDRVAESNGVVLRALIEGKYAAGGIG